MTLCTVTTRHLKTPRSKRCRLGPVSLRNWPEVHLKRCRCATVICPPGRRSAAAAPAARQPTLPRPPTLKAVKLAFVPAPPHAARMRLRLQSRQLGSSPLSTFAAQGTSALTATRRRDCGRRSRPQTRSSPRTNGLPAAPVCSRPAPCPRTFRGKAVTVGSRQTLHFSPWRSFVPGFASVNRAGSSPPSLPREVQ